MGKLKPDFQVSKCGDSGCKEEPLAAEEEKQVLSQNTLLKFSVLSVLKSQTLSEQRDSICSAKQSRTIFRQLDVPSAGASTRIQTRRCTSLVAQTRRTWTSHSCRERSQLHLTQPPPSAINGFSFRANSSTIVTELTMQAMIAFIDKLQI